LSVEPIGILTIVAGLICLQIGYLATFQVMVILTLLGSAAAFLVGGANIPPAHLFLVFVAVSIFHRKQTLDAAVGVLRFPRPGYWLLCLLIYGIIMGYAVPRLFEGSIQIIPLGTSEHAETGSTVPLGPVTSNFTQAIYLTSDLVCFALSAAIAATPAGFTAIANALLAYAVGNVAFALLDVSTYVTNTQWLLGWIRNAQYVLHVSEEVSGLKRIAGSFTEASAFSRATLGALGFCGTLWLCGRRPALTGWLAVASIALLLFSTSSTGLAGVPLIGVIIVATATARGGFHATRPLSSSLLLCAPLIAIAAVLIAQMNLDATEPLKGYIDELLFNKGTTASGIERSTWNEVALQNFLDSYGLGVGLGTVRTSSFPVAVLSNVGVPGMIFYLLFAVSAFGSMRGPARSYQTDVRLAARNACFGLIIGDLFSGTTVEQGLLFYVLAGLACCSPKEEANLDA
jgi:hypothetical protein